MVEPPRTHVTKLYTLCYLCYDVVREGSMRFDVLEPPRTHVTKLYTPYYLCNDVVREGSTRFDVLEPPRTSAQLESHHYRDSKVFRVVSHEFGVVRLYRTFSIYIVAGETRCAGCLCTSSGWFKHIEPHRTFSNHIITKIARCVEFCHMSSAWFDCTEPSLSTSLQR